MASECGVQPFVTHFQGKTKLTSCDFLKIFREFDKDGNGFIEAGELDEFLKALWKEGHPGKNEPDSNEIDSMKEAILQKFDDNFDRKINLEELARILPTEENFLAQFQHTTNLTSVDFFKVWTHYDLDRSGYIESNELEGFLVDLLGREGMSLDPQRVCDYKDAMLDLFDKNKDGKLSLSEMSKILPMEENFLNRKINDAQFDDIWNKYDQDGSGFIADDEIDALIHDLLKRNSEGEVEVEDIKKFKAVLMESFDTNKDGKIGKDELKLLLVAQKS
ncbi:calretinin-like isoform X2 [Orbicella faveolata]|uniref:calretinin-like isoform X2 n=1 Tax=Orbicella faveolata TaxID=48498 RepID=UPI0009E30A2B|nr:calretinin-like isoform X2 [Orbicella faveolata]